MKDYSQYEDMSHKESRRETKIKHHLMDKRGNKTRTQKSSHRVEKKRDWD